MKIKTHWAWKIYFFLYCIPIINNIFSLFMQDSLVDSYYRILIAFKESYHILYYFNISAVIIDAIALIPLFLFVFHKRLLSPFIWKLIFILRIAVFLPGHCYEWKMIKSFFYFDINAAIGIVSFIILVILPSYIACFKYAFQQKSLFKEKA